MLGEIEPKPKWEWTADKEAYTEPWKSIHGAYTATFDGNDFEIPAVATKEWIAQTYEAPRDTAEKR